MRESVIHLSLLICDNCLSTSLQMMLSPCFVLSCVVCNDFFFCSFLVGCLTFLGRIIQSWQEIGVGLLWGLHKFFVRARRKLFLWISWISARRMLISFALYTHFFSLCCELLIICYTFSLFFFFFFFLNYMLLVNCIQSLPYTFS
jgi:hypothetical protein